MRIIRSWHCSAFCLASRSLCSFSARNHRTSASCCTSWASKSSSNFFVGGGGWQSGAKCLSEICSLPKPYIGENLDQAKDLPMSLKTLRAWPWEGGTVKYHSRTALEPHGNMETWKHGNQLITRNLETRNSETKIYFYSYVHSTLDLLFLVIF